ncbi:MAG: hypothetical protein NPIRA02_11800 [Nitrospirales bacterium]|nr:MAG: hypothetical protein NPIRA02_11800 [Nitrospirales bacterium]
MIKPPTMTTRGAQPKNSAFAFVVMGDVPYSPKDQQQFPKLIQRINAIKPSLLFHVGDLKAGKTPCEREIFQKVKGNLNTFQCPVVYTPWRQ